MIRVLKSLQFIFLLALLCLPLVVQTPAPNQPGDLRNIKNGHEQLRDAVAPGRFRADINPALERVIMNALARNPQQRPASALELSRELSEALQHTTTFSDVTPVTMERITPASAPQQP